ncbi:MAG: TonB-dependent receptor [Spirochaetaceae bacterium]|jgi:vitamin B12 transporter|nr:TonB-dependent receptor [Spirochaetaceae bacterium]
MRSSSHKAGGFLPAGLVILCLLFPCFFLSGQEEGEDDYLEDLPVMEDGGITVVGTPETTQEMRVLTKEEIDRLQAPDLATLLQETLNLGVTRYGAYGNMTDINMRGFDTERIAILINGVPANSPLSGEFEISQVDLNAVERIEVIYGGSDSKYNVSGSLGGVINIITVKNQKPGLRIGAGLSNTSALPGNYYILGGERGTPQWQDLADAQNLSFSAAYGAENYSWSAGVFGNRAANHYLYRDAYKRIRRKENNEVYDTGINASYIRNFPDLSKLIFSADAYYGDKNIPTSGYASTMGNQRDFSTRQNIMLDMPRAFRDDLAAEASVNHTWVTLGYDPPSGASSLHDEHIITAINRWHWYPFSRLTFRAGGDYRFITLDSTDMRSRSQHDGGLYLTGEFKPVEKLLIVPSVKGVFNSNGASPVVPVPKFGFAWFITEDLTVRNNYFRSFKYPDFEDLYWPDQGDMAGNPDLKPEDGWGVDLGAAYRYRILSLNTTFFTQWTGDSVHWAPGTDGVWRPSNVGEAVFFGFDGKASFDVPLPRGPFKKIIPSLTYQYMLSFLLSYGYDFASQKRIPYMPAHTVGFSLDLPWGTGSQRAGSLLVTGYFEGRRYTDTANITRLPPHFLLNANINQKIRDNLTVFGEFRNILNSRYESFYEYPMPGLTFTMGIRVAIEGLGIEGLGLSKNEGPLD